METSYSVYFGKEAVGKVQVHREGLYYRILCRCHMTGEIMFCLVASCGEKTENLGVVVPMDGGFGLDTKLPVKHLGEGEMHFTLLPKREGSRQGVFVPIYPEEPFAYLSRLKDAFLATQGDQVGAMLKE